MKVSHAKKELKRLESEASYNAGFAPEIVKAFRRRMQLIRAAADERDLRAFPGMRLERLKGNRSHQHSIRLNDQWRLILEMNGKERFVLVVSIEDYH